jgi:hypothetical protein
METLTSTPIELPEWTSPTAQAQAEIDDAYNDLLANSNDRTVEMYLGPDFARETSSDPGVLAWWERAERDLDTERLVHPSDDPELAELLPRFAPLKRPVVPVIPGKPETVEAPAPLVVSEQAVAVDGVARHRRQSASIRERATDFIGDAVASVQEALQRSLEHGRLGRIKEALQPNRRRLTLAMGALALGGVLSYATHDAPIAPKEQPAAAAVAPNPFMGPQMSGKQMGPPMAGPVERVVPPVSINPKHVNKSQRILPGGGGNKINLPGSETRVRSDSLSFDERITIIEKKMTLAEAQISPAGYEAFVPTMVDLTKQVPKKMSNYNGHNWSEAKPDLPEDIKYYVWHFTATPRKANHYEGMKFAGTMQNSGSLAVQDYVSRPGTWYELTNNRTYHVRGHNSISMGVEIAAACQEDVEPEQYVGAVYGTANFLIEEGYITKDTTSVRKVVDSVMRGHRELNPNGHHDFPALVMDQGRRMVADLIISMGYGEGKNKQS